MSGTSENPVVFYALWLMNTLKNYPKSEIFDEKWNSLYNKDKEAGNQAFAEVKPLLEFYAEKQVPSAQTFLGFMYVFGFGVKEDNAEAVKWFQKAAEHGDANSQFFLGSMYADHEEAVKWLQKAIEQGHAYAQYILGLLYSIGLGVEKDYAEAVKCFTKVAEQGNVSAQFLLGNMYSVGDGVNQDYKTAYMWYFLAGLNGWDTNDKVRNLETDGWFSSAKVSPSEAREAKAEATRKYNEIRKRYGLD